LRAMMDLAANRDDTTPVFLSSIARRQNISEKYLEQIFSTLQSSGLVRTVRGRKGGYLLTRPAREITLIEIFRVLEGPSELVTCITQPATCARSQECATRELWQMLRAGIEEILGGMTLADLTERQKRIDDREAAMYYI
jgi:Rrf2 family transcriptional regulator, cysteine metabolism repressor